MNISQEFSVQAPADKVWAFLTNPEQVATALPGAHLTEKIDDNNYEGGMSVRVGPMSANYEGTVSFELDEATRTATVRARGQGKAGMGSADMSMTSTVTAISESHTKVAVDADLVIKGVLAQFGRGMIEQVSKKMFGEFADAVRARLETR